MSDGELRQTMKRLMSIHDEIDEKKLDLKTVYADAKSAGFDKTALGLAIRQIRSREKNETPAAQERSAMVELYVSAFDNAPRTYVHVPAREAVPRQNPSEEEVASAVRAGAPVSKTATPGSLPAAQSEAAAGSRPEQGADESTAGDGEAIPVQSAQFVTPAGEGEGVRASADPSPAADEPIKGLAAANAIAAKAASLVSAQPRRRPDEGMPDIPAFLRRSRDSHQSMGEQA